MRSPINPKPRSRLSPDAFALALLLASSLQIMENLLPRVPIFPWLKLGFSYVIILPFLLWYGAVPAFALLVARNLLGVLYGGQLFSTFLISTGAGAVAFLVLGLPVAWAYSHKGLGVVGASVLLATTFNLTQLVLVEWVLIGHSGFFFQVGPLLAWSILSGVGVAYLIRWSEQDLQGALAWESDSPAADRAHPGSSSLPSPVARWKFPLGLALMALVLGMHSLPLQAVALPMLLVLAQRRWKTLWTAWPLLFYLAWLHLFHTPGRYVFYGGVTREGLEAFAFHTVRLFNLVLLGQWLARTLPLGWMRKSSRPYLRGFLIALPLLPGLFSFSVAAGRQVVSRWFAGERKNLLTPVFDAWKSALEGGDGHADETSST